MPINDQYFRNLMRDRGVSLRSLATELGMGQHSQLSLMLADKRRMQLDEAIALSRIFSVPLEEIIANAGFPEVMKRGKRLPIVGILRGSGEVEAVPANTERAVAPQIDAPIVSAVQARTVETALHWMNRFVFYCEDRDDPKEAMIDRFCHLKIKKGPQVVAKLRRGYTNGTFALSGPFSAESAVVEWAAPIAFIRT